MKEKNNNHNHDTITVAAFLNRAEIDYLDKVGKDYFFKFGHKLSRGKILSELVDLLMHIKIHLEDIDFEHEKLWEGIMRLMNHEDTPKV